jgi:phytoene dehydrogenase-like protein
MSDHTVAVIGAGLAGLETARRLAAAGVSVTVFEAEEAVGGRVRTQHSEGFTLDRGFQVLFTAYPEAKRALDLEALDLQRFPSGAVVCRPNHRGVIADPLRDPWRAIETALSRDLTLGDKLETLRLRRDLRGRSRAAIYDGPDETIAAYLRDRGFSERFVEDFTAPFYGGITLDRSLSTSSRVFQFTFRMLTEGAAAVPAAGMGAIPRQLADRAREQGATIETGTRIENCTGGGPVSLDLAGETLTVDAAVVAAGPEASRRLTGLESIPTDARGVHTQYFRISSDSPIAEQPRIHLNAAEPVPNQVVSLSAVAPKYGDGSDALLAASTPTSTAPDPDQLADRTRAAIESWYPEASFDDLELLETVTVPFAQYAQPPGTHETLPAVTDPEGAVFLAGDITTDASINGALRSGRLAAEAVLDSEVGP